MSGYLILLAAAASLIIAGVAAFDWRMGVICAGLVLAAAALLMDTDDEDQ